MVQSLPCYKSQNGNHLCLISSFKTKGQTSLNAPSKRHMWNAGDSRKNHLTSMNYLQRHVKAEAFALEQFNAVLLQPVL